MRVREVLPILPSRRAIRRVVGRPLHALDPVSRAAPARWPGAVPEGGALCCIYRQRFVPAVEVLVADAQTAGLQVALWGLDGPAPSLAAETVGTGPGLRMPLLERLVASLGDGAPGPLVLADDDIAFRRGGLADLLRAVDRCGFDLAQPAHDSASYCSYRATYSRFLTFARRVTWVEVGPLVVVSPAWRDRVVPFPEGSGMGWGLEMRWSALAREGCRLGIVDAVTVEHLALTASDYDADPERARAGAIRSELGIGRITDLQRTLGAWRAWQADPPWESAP